MNKLTIYAPTIFGVRGADCQGSGGWKAGRKNHLHSGLDFIAPEGCTVSSPVEGVVRRLGICYGDTDAFRLVEIEHSQALIRVLYLKPSVGVGDFVYPGKPIGSAQAISSRYKGITDHVHLDVRLTDTLATKGSMPKEEVWVNPALFMEERRDLG